MEKLYPSKTFLKMTGERVHNSHPTPLAIRYRNYQKSLVYFSHLAPLILFFFNFVFKRPSQRGGGAWHNAPLKYAPAFKLLV